MIKLVSIPIRDDDYTYGELAERWRGSHTELAREFPGLVKYATNVPIDSEWSEYGGIIELYFEDMTTLKAALGSGIGQHVNAGAATFTGMERGPTLCVEEVVHLDRS